MSYMGKVRPTIALTSADIEDGAILNVDVNASAAIANSKMATDTTNATNLASGTVPTARLGSGSASSSTFLTGAQTYAAVDTSGITANQDDIALLGFKVAANGSLARYNLVDQSIDAFEDASGVDASASTNETRDTTNYYSGVSVGVPTGDGTVTTHGVYTVHTFTADGDFIAPVAGTVDYLMVAGGGGGGGASGAWTSGGGGGGGGALTATGLAVSAATHGVVIGAGGTGGTNNESPGPVALAGGDTTFNSLTADGGGLGGSYAAAASSQDGGSGGGGSGFQTRAGGTATVGQGYDGAGGNGAQNSTVYGGAGGGAGAVGTAGAGGAGGVGVSNDYRTGSPITYAGGGGGGRGSGSGGVGGAGGGGNGAAGAYNNGSAGTDGLGGGGGGATSNDPGPSQSGGDGGNGIVVLRFNTSTGFATYNNMTLVSNAQTAQSAPTTGDLVITYSDGAGTATVNTDIKAYISRDGSAYTSAVTLVSQGTTGGHTILTANGVDLSGITSGTSMRWKIETLNQSVSKDTRIQAVSLGWS